MNPTPRTQRLRTPGAGAWRVHAAAVERRAAGEPVILLSIGEHDFDPHHRVVDAAIASLRNGRHHYTPAGGIRALREAVAAWQSELSGVVFAPGQITILPGAQGALFAACQCLFEAGDEVIVLEPMYATYEGTVQASGATPVSVPMWDGRRFSFSAAAIERAVCARTRGLLLNSPHNPTGLVIDDATLEAIAELVRRHDLWVVSDEVYAPLTFDARHRSIAALPGMAERTVIVNSLSKSHAMSGWRLGWAASPPAIAAGLEDLVGCMLFGLPPFVQDAAIVALAEGRPMLDDMVARYRRRRDLVIGCLARLPAVRATVPQGSMFVMIDVSATGNDGESFAWRLLEEHGVAVLPGAGLGLSTRDFVRLSLTAPDSDLQTACERIGLLAAGRQSASRAGAPRA
jgi:arginine:pyruvate transaminase